MKGDLVRSVVALNISRQGIGLKPNNKGTMATATKPLPLPKQMIPRRESFDREHELPLLVTFNPSKN